MQYLLSLNILQLKMLVRDSKRQAKQVIESAFRLTQRGCVGAGDKITPLVGVIGPASSGPTIATSNTFSIPSIDRTVIGYSATSADLSGPSFSNFLRTPPSDAVQAQMMATLMKGLSAILDCLPGNC